MPQRVRPEVITDSIWSNNGQKTVPVGKRKSRQSVYGASLTYSPRPQHYVAWAFIEIELFSMYLVTFGGLPFHKHVQHPFSRDAIQYKPKCYIASEVHTQILKSPESPALQAWSDDVRISRHNSPVS